MDYVLRNDKLDHYILNESFLINYIQENKPIDSYYKIPMLKVGDYVTCCNKNESLDPHNTVDNPYQHGWVSEKVVEIHEVEIRSGAYYVRSLSYYLFINGIRFATKEEIALYNSKQE